MPRLTGSNGPDFCHRNYRHNKVCNLGASYHARCYIAGVRRAPCPQFGRCRRAQPRPSAGTLVAFTVSVTNNGVAACAATGYALAFSVQ